MDMKESKLEPQQEQLDIPVVSTSNWFKTEQIETNVAGERKKLVVLHLCGDDKEALIGQLKTMILGLETNFDWFAS